MISFSRLAAAAICALSLGAASTASAAPAPCDDNCLLGVAGQYMDSLSANDPAGAPFARNLRSTENGVDTPLTAGVWTTARSWLYRHTFVDAVTGEIGAYGTVHQADNTDAMLAMRLKVVNRKITESELLVVRPGDFALFQPRWTSEPKPVFTSLLPADHRMTREALAAIPAKYFDALAAGDPSLVPVNPDANRVENGIQTTNNPGFYSPSISEGIRRLVYMSGRREFRVPVVDTDHGLVWAIVAIDMPMMNKTIMVRGKPVKIDAQEHHLPRSLLLYELFKVEDGRITGIEAVMHNAPLGTSMGWAR